MKIDPKDAFTKTVLFVHDKAVEAAGAAAASAKKAQEAASGAVKQAGEAVDAGQKRVRTALYSPVFPEEYADPDYDRPKMIVIEDGDERKGIDVCEGSIGWFGKAADLDVLHLYEKAVPMSGVDFFPQPECGAVYFENKITPQRYINLDCYFDVIEKDKFTELRRIAYDLGAKRCVLESYEELKTVRVAKAGVGDKFKGISLLKREPRGREQGVDEGSGEEKKPVKSSTVSGELAHTGLDFSSSSSKSIVFSQTFEGNASPKRPELKWFKNDKEIEFLIDTRCNGEDANKTKSYCIQLDSASTQTMSVALAAKVDKALGKLGCICNFSIEGEAKTEARKKFVFEIEF